MEGPPSLDDSEDPKGTRSKKKKRAEALGSFVVEPKDKESQNKDKPRPWWQTEEDAAGSSEKQAKPPRDEQAEKLSEAEAADSEASEILTPEEERLVERETAQAGREHDAETSTEEDDDPLQAAIAAALERFRAKIIEEGKDSDAALSETLAEMEADPDQEDTPAGTAEEVWLEASDVPLHKWPSMQEEAPASSTQAQNFETTIPSRKSAPSSRIAGMWPPRSSGNPRLDRLMPKSYDRVPLYSESAFLSAASMEGVIGYLIGRRKGRLKTEKKLLPVQKKLEKEVGGLQRRLREKEQIIREAAIKQIREKHWQNTETPSHERPSETPTEARLQMKTSERRQAEPRLQAPEAHQLHGTQIAPERIGHVLINTDSKREASPSEREATHSPAVEKSVETMDRSKLLELSRTIVVDGTSLHQIYETHLIGEKGLRRLIKEHLRGGDMKKALKREIIEREIDFERDPAVRDHGPHGEKITENNKGQEQELGKILRQANAADYQQNEEEVAFYKARAVYEASQQELRHKRQRVVDISLEAVIATLLAVVIFLLATRS